MQLLFAFLFAILPPCATEDSSWCGWDGGADGQGERYVSLWMRDPAPYIITEGGEVR